MSRPRLLHSTLLIERCGVHLDDGFLDGIGESQKEPAGVKRKSFVLFRWGFSVSVASVWTTQEGREPERTPMGLNKYHLVNCCRRGATIDRCLAVVLLLFSPLAAKRRPGRSVSESALRDIEGFSYEGGGREKLGRSERTGRTACGRGSYIDQGNSLVQYHPIPNTQYTPERRFQL